MEGRKKNKRISLTGTLGRQSSFALLGLSVVSILLIGLYDLETGFEVGFYIFYLVPICVSTWYVSFRAGVAMSVLSALVWYLAGELGGLRHSHWIVPYWNMFMRAVALVILVVFLTKVRGAFDMQKRLSRTDHLTGIMNRATFMNQTALEIERARRHKRPFTSAFIDIDDFKFVNDRYGHKKGDQLLKLAAETIKNNIRSIDVVARFGGDEFVLLLPETGAASAAILFRRLKEKLIDAVREAHLPVTFSFGVATYLSPPQTPEEMVTQADGLMYDAKRAGKNQIKQDIYEAKPQH